MTAIHERPTSTLSSGFDGGNPTDPTSTMGNTSGSGGRKKTVRNVGIITAAAVAVATPVAAFFLGRSGGNADQVTVKDPVVEEVPVGQGPGVTSPEVSPPTSVTTEVPQETDMAPKSQVELVQELRGERDPELNAAYLAVAQGVNDFVFGKNGETVSDNWGALTDTPDDAVFMWITENPKYPDHKAQFIVAPKLEVSTLNHEYRVKEELVVQFSPHDARGKRDINLVTLRVGFNTQNQPYVKRTTGYYIGESQQIDTEESTEAEDVKGAIQTIQDLLEQAKQETKPQERAEKSALLLEQHPDYDRDSLDVFSDYS